MLLPKNQRQLANTRRSVIALAVSAAISSGMYTKTIQAQDYLAPPDGTITFLGFLDDAYNADQNASYFFDGGFINLSNDESINILADEVYVNIDSLIISDNLFLNRSPSSDVEIFSQANTTIDQSFYRQESYDPNATGRFYFTHQNETIDFYGDTFIETDAATSTILFENTIFDANRQGGSFFKSHNANGSDTITFRSSDIFNFNADFGGGTDTLSFEDSRVLDRINVTQTVSGGDGNDTLTFTGRTAIDIYPFDNTWENIVFNAGTHDWRGRIIDSSNALITIDGDVTINNNDSITQTLHEVNGSGSITNDEGNLEFLNLSGYTGTFRINQDTVRLVDTSLNWATIINANGTLELNHDNDVDLTVAPTGSGNLVKSGSGSLSLLGADPFGAFTGTYTMEAGSTVFSTDQNIDIAVIANGGTFIADYNSASGVNFLNHDFTIGDDVTFAGSELTAIFNVGSRAAPQNIVLSGETQNIIFAQSLGASSTSNIIIVHGGISGAGDLTVENDGSFDASGRLSILGTSNHSGDLYISGQSVTVDLDSDSGNALTSANIYVQNGASLDTLNSNQIANGSNLSLSDGGLYFVGYDDISEFINRLEVDNASEFLSPYADTTFGFNEGFFEGEVRSLGARFTFVKESAGTFDFAPNAGSNLVSLIDVNGGTFNFQNVGFANNIENDATVNFINADDITVAGQLSGSGNFIKSDTGALSFTNATPFVNATGSYTQQAGETIFNGQNIDIAIIANSGTLTNSNTSQATSLTQGLSMDGDLTLNGLFNITAATEALTIGAGNNNLTLNGSANVAGIQGTGNLTLSSTNTAQFTINEQSSHSGDLTITDNVTLTASSLNGNAINSSNVYLQNGSLNTSTASNQFASTSNLFLEGVSSLQLNTGGIADYQEAINTLEVSQDSTVILGTNTSLQVNAGELLGSLSGAGEFIKAGTGTFTVASSNFNIGDLIVNGGELLFNNVGYDSAFTNNALVTFNNSDAVTLAGEGNGAGAFSKTGAGTLTLAAAQTHTGGTTISEGQVNLEAEYLSGNIVNNGTLNYIGGNTVSADISGSGDVSLQDSDYLLTGNLTHSGLLNVLNSNVNFAVSATPTADIVLDENSTLSLTDTGSYQLQQNISGAGNIILSQAGSLELFDIANLSGDIINQANGSITLNSFAAANTFTGNIANQAAGNITLNNFSSFSNNISNSGRVQFNQTEDGTYSGIASGTGVYAKTGAGTLTLTTPQLFTSDFELLEGSLALNSGILNAGIVTSTNTEVVFNETSDASWAHSISGAGAFTKTGAGTLTLAAAQTHTGGTTIAEGSLLTRPEYLTGDIANQGQLIFIGEADESSTNLLSVNNLISGSGAVQFNGGSFQLLQTQSYTGLTELVAANLTLAPNAITGEINLDDTSSLIFETDSDATFNGQFTGAGTVSKTGTGNLTITDTTDFTGNFSVDAGALTFSNFSNFGFNVQNNSVLAFNHSGDTLFTGQVQGNGDMSVQTDGRFTIDASSVIANNLLAQSGTTQVNGLVQGNVTVFDNATLEGNGSISSLTMQGGILAPGTSIGTLNIEGDADLSNSIYQFEFNEFGESDQLFVAGTANLTNTFIELLPEAGDYNNPIELQLISANNIVGEAEISDLSSTDFAFLNTSFSYTDSGLVAFIERNEVAMPDVARTFNQRSVSEVLAAIFAADNATFQPLFNELMVQTNANVRAAYDLLSGVEYTYASYLAVQDSRLFTNRAARAKQLGAWVDIAGARTDVAGNSNVYGEQGNHGALSGGYQWQLGSAWKWGITAGVGRTEADRLDLNRTSVGVNTNWQSENFYVSAQLSQNRFTADVQRRGNIGDIGINQTNSTDIDVSSASIDVGYRVTYNGIAYTPYLGLGLENSDQAEVNESLSNGDFALQVLSDSRTHSWARAGAKVDWNLFTSGKTNWKAQLKAEYLHQFQTDAPAANIRFINGPQRYFSVLGAPYESVTKIDANLSINFGETGQLQLGYFGQFGEQVDQHGIGLNARWSW